VGGKDREGGRRGYVDSDVDPDHVDSRARHAAMEGRTRDALTRVST
jgi:hypothetical protein